MALRIEKAFGVKMDTLMRMQTLTISFGPANVKSKSMCGGFTRQFGSHVSALRLPDIRPWLTALETGPGILHNRGVSNEEAQLPMIHKAKDLSPQQKLGP